MQRLDPTRCPRPLAPAHAEIAQRLESAGVAVWHQGEGLLDDLLGREPGHPDPPGSARTPVLLCAARAEALLGVLPNAVVTAEQARRLTQGTASGPIDLLPMGPGPIAESLPRFGLSALSFAWRPIGEEWCDPVDARSLLARGLLGLSGHAENDNPVARAPRRYWMTARLLSEYALEPTGALLAAARSAFEASQEELPRGAPARRELTRVLLSDHPRPGLQFLADVGLAQSLLPGIEADAPEIVETLPLEPGLRFAAWLAGTSTQRALRLLRMPRGLAREIERLGRHHPIERSTAVDRETGLRRLLQRLSPQEIEHLLAWRRRELERAKPDPETEEAWRRLEALAAGIHRLEDQRSALDRIRQLAFDGQVVMTLLGRGPGPHVGEALAHLADFVSRHPEANERAALEAELRDWDARSKAT